MIETYKVIGEELFIDVDIDENPNLPKINRSDMFLVSNSGLLKIDKKGFEVEEIRKYVKYIGEGIDTKDMLYDRYKDYSNYYIFRAILTHNLNIPLLIEINKDIYNNENIEVFVLVKKTLAGTEENAEKIIKPLIKDYNSYLNKFIYCAITYNYVSCSCCGHESKSINETYSDIYASDSKELKKKLELLTRKFITLI